MGQLSVLKDMLATAPGLMSLRDAAWDAHTDVLDLTGPAAARQVIAAALAAGRPGGGARATRPVLLVATATSREAEELADALGDLLDEHAVALYPSWETLPHERLSPRSDTVGRRLAVLRRLAHPEVGVPGRDRPSVVVAPVRSLLQPQVAGLGDITPVELRRGQEIALPGLVRGLVGAAYARVDMVERRGEFAVRGGLVDVFPPTTDHPVRVEFFGDEVEEIREFAVADQRSSGVTHDRLWAPPCREMLLTTAVRQRAGALAQQYPALADMLGKIEQGIAVEGMESLAPVLVERMELLTDVLPAGSLVLACDPERIHARAVDLVRTSEEFREASWSAASSGGVAPIDVAGASFRTLADVRMHTLGRGVGWWTLSPFAMDTGPFAMDTGDEDTGMDHGTTATRDPGVAETPEFRGVISEAAARLGEWVKAGRRVLVITGGSGTATRIAAQLRELELPARADHALDQAPRPGTITVTKGRIARGFMVADADLVVVAETDLTGRRGTAESTARRLPGRRRATIDPLTLTAGDVVVHEQHGIGKYVELVQRTVQGATREYLVLEFAPAKRGQPGDRLFVPMDQLDQVTKYVGGDEPALDRIGGADWTKRKNRARAAVREIAAELIKLYAARQASPGRAFGPDTPWQRELEDAFPYVETADQMATIEDVKRDMERAIPMDRVICGDVGYGKTEIAVRAAFKAVQEGTQVAVLVPTTLLVQQHLQTFSERYAPFPVTVRALSRFQSAAETDAVVAGLADGSVDVVIGTHRLLQSGLRFKDLGLVIVDEEQRFGVEQKERLKHVRANIDVLSMSATPIPRTLEMSITGIRDMSTIATPPEERHPILTYVGGFDERQVGAAIRRELLREGQVFYVHNRVDTIEATAARIREIVPEARTVTAHGQMSETRLEGVIEDFWEKRADVLVCTTIVETGLDISNANTLIVDRADILGLSQLHQLRGRVGRGRERAYAYFLYPREKPLSETAHQRLTTIAQHSELGAGMQVAMKDLEIRGAGNLLGAEQSGRIADVGFDLYVRLVGEAVAEFRGDGGPTTREVRVDLPVDAHMPHDYVPSDRLRLDAYRRLSEASSEEQIDALVAELTDRYGPLPDVAAALVEVARFRVALLPSTIEDIVIQGQHIRIAPLDLLDWQQVRLRRVHPRALVRPAQSLVLLPRPREGQTAAGAPLGAPPLSGIALLVWLRRELTELGVIAAPAAGTAGATRGPSAAAAGSAPARPGRGADQGRGKSTADRRGTTSPATKTPVRPPAAAQPPVTPPPARPAPRATPPTAQPGGALHSTDRPVRRRRGN